MTVFDDKPVHLIFQTGNFNFFNSIQWKSIAMLELIKKHCNFIYVDLHQRSNVKHEAVSNLNAIRLNLSNIIADKTTTFDQAKKQIVSYLDATKPKTLSLYNGNTNSVYDRELEFWHAYCDCKKLHDVAMFGMLKNPELSLTYVIMYIMAEWCAANNVVVYNMCEDPLQHKLDYIDGLKIQHYYFHFVPNNIYEHPTKQGDSRQYSFKFSPSQEYWYTMCQHREMPNKPCKSFNFVFAMTDSWLNVHDRTNIILEMEHLADPEFAKQNNFMFKYRSFRTSVKWKYNTSLMPYDLYMEHIMRSKFTLSIPSYDTNCFSLRRFFEALTNDCIPLILDTCNYKYGFNCNDEFIQFIEDNLLVSFNDLHKLNYIVEDKCKHYDELLFKLKQTKYWKAYNNPLLYAKHVKALYIDVDSDNTTCNIDNCNK